MALQVERREGVLQVEMARPEVLNAFDEAMIEELISAFTDAAGDAQVRAVVLRGSGKSFSAGADIAWMKRQSAASEDANRADARRFATMLDVIARCPKPTIARVQGACMGGGVGLACACDFTIAGESARFAVSEARFGLTATVIAPYVIAAAGVRQAKRLALSATRIDARQAMALGIAHEVVADERLDEAVAALADELRACGPRAQAEIKAIYAKLAAMPPGDERVEFTAATVARVRAGEEAREGFAAFLEKRPPRWNA
jgi:methylglutaconyl-CoA hydratase